MFKHLRTKLTVLYAGLFSLTLLIMAAASYAAMATGAARHVREELGVGAASFERIWSLRAENLQQGAAVLARDFGFREAVATGDGETIRSALDNLRARQKLDLAVLVAADGSVLTHDGTPISEGGVFDQLLFEQAASRGAFILNGRPYQAIAEPVSVPDFAGMVIFAVELDPEMLADLGRSSGIAVHSSLHTRKGGTWAALQPGPPADRAALSRAVGQALLAPAGEAQRFPLSDGPQIAVASPLQGLGGTDPIVLLLRYPLGPALAPLHSLMLLLLVIGCGALTLVLLGGWALASSVTGPLHRLNSAARSLGQGEAASVTVTGRDEISHLAQRFNLMAGEIRAREQAMRADAVALASALDQARSANRQSQAFLANMSHELRTPLNGVLGLSCVLEQLLQDPDQREMAQRIAGSASELEQMLSQLLDAARLGAGRAEVSEEAFELQPVLAAAAEAWRARAEDQGLVFEADLLGAAGAHVCGDAGSLRRVLDALLDNAVKFTDAGSVHLAVAALGEDRWRLTVSDTGMGFEPEAAERIFEPFVQADNAVTRRHGGAGVGLSNARGLAELMGGTLMAEARPGLGAAFHFELALPPVAALERWAA